MEYHGSQWYWHYSLMVMATSKTTAPIHTAHVANNWYKEHESELEHMDWPPQSSDLDIIEHM